MSEQNPEIERQAFSAAEFARAIGRDPATVYRAIYRGDLKVIDYGGRIMIPAREVTRFFGKVKVYTPRKRKPKKQPAEATQ